MRTPRTALLLAALALPLALGCGGGSPTTKPADQDAYRKKMEESQQKENQQRKGNVMPTGTSAKE